MNADEGLLRALPPDRLAEDMLVAEVQYILFNFIILVATDCLNLQGSKEDVVVVVYDL